MRHSIILSIILLGLFLIPFGSASAQQSARLDLVPLHAGADSVVIQAVMTENMNVMFAMEAVYVALGYDPNLFSPDMTRTVTQHHFASVGFISDSVPFLDSDGVFPDIALYGESHPNFGTTPIFPASVHNLCTFTLFPKSTSSGTSSFIVIGNSVTNARTGYYINTSLQNQPFTPANDLINLFYPIELSSLTAAQQGKAVVVRWSTSSETNNNGFSIERRPGGELGNWESIGFVQGAGSSTQERQYLFFDNKLPADGWYEYRLKQTDLDGTSTLTRSVRVEYRGIPGSWSLDPAWPNPASLGAGQPVRLTYMAPERATITLRVTNTLGQEVALLFHGIQDAGSYTMPWHVAGAQPGLYFCTLTGQSLSTGTVWSRTEKIRLMP